MLCLCSHTRIEHNGEITTCRVLHSNRNVNTTGCQTMCLILHTSRTNCHIGEDILQIWPVIGIQHLIGCSQSCLTDCLDVHLTDCLYALDEIRLILRIWLMQHTLVSRTVCTRFIRIDSWNYKNLIFDLLSNGCQPAQIIKHGILIIRRARTDDCDKLIGFTGKYLLNLSISFCLDLL